MPLNPLPRPAVPAAFNPTKLPRTTAPVDDVPTTLIPPWRLPATTLAVAVEVPPTVVFGEWPTPIPQNPFPSFDDWAACKPMTLPAITFPVPAPSNQIPIPPLLDT